MAATRTDRASAQRKSLRERVGALRNLPPFLRQVWETSPALTLASLSLRLVRALLPVVTLYVGWPSHRMYSGASWRWWTRCCPSASPTRPACA